MARRTVDGIDFFVPDRGGYVRVEEGRNHGVLGKQIFRTSIGGDGWHGSAVYATPATLERAAKAWLRRNPPNRGEQK